MKPLAQDLKVMVLLAAALLWCGALVEVMFLGGFGIYLGRFLRWHSLSVVSDPILLLADVAEPRTSPVVHSKAWAVTLGFGVMLSIGYVFLVVAGGQAAVPRENRSTPVGGPGVSGGELRVSG